MSIISSLFSNPAASLVKEVGNTLDKVFTSKEEVLSKEIILERMNQELLKGQIEVNKLEAQSKSLFNSGWRPFIGWVCGVGLAYALCRDPNVETIHSLILALLGLGSLRTFEKLKGITR